MTGITKGELDKRPASLLASADPFTAAPDFDTHF